MDSITWPGGHFGRCRLAQVRTQSAGRLLAFYEAFPLQCWFPTEPWRILGPLPRPWRLLAWSEVSRNKTDRLSTDPSWEPAMSDDSTDQKSSTPLCGSSSHVQNRKMAWYTVRSKMAALVELWARLWVTSAGGREVRLLCRQYTIIMLYSYLHRHVHSRCVDPVLSGRISCNHAKFRLDE